MTGAIGSYAFTFFLPIILKDSLNFLEELAFILAAPPTLFAVLVGLVFSWLADKTKLRGPYIIIEGVIALIRFCMVGFLHHPVTRLVGKI